MYASTSRDSEQLPLSAVVLFGRTAEMKLVILLVLMEMVYTTAALNNGVARTPPSKSRDCVS